MKAIAFIILLLSSLSFGQSPGDVFVATNGNDSTGTGTFAAPYKTCAKAQTAIQAIVTANPSRTTPFTVVIRGGVYQLPVGSTQHCAFTSSDNGLSTSVNVIYMAYPGEYPIFDGGIPVTGWTDAGTACASSSCEKYTKVLSASTVNFENLWYGQTYPISTISCTSGTVSVKTTVATQLANGYPMQVTGNPSFNTNQGTAVASVSTTTFANDTFTYVMPGGVCPNGPGGGGNIIYSSRRSRPRWNLSGAAVLGTAFRDVRATFASSPPTPCLDDGSHSNFVCLDRVGYTAANLSGLPVSNVHSNFNGTTTGGAASCTAIGGNTYPDGDLEILLFNNSVSPKMRVYCIDGTNNIIYFMGPVYVPSTVYIAALANPNNHRYVIENVKYTDANAIPQTFYLDRSSSPWTLIYYAASGENPNTDQVVVPQMNPVITLNNVRYMTFSGINVVHDNWIVPTNGYSDVRGGMIMSYNSGTHTYTNSGITAAVSCLNCQDTKWFGDIVSQTAGNGIEFWTSVTTLTTANNVIKNGSYFDLGYGGVRLGMIPTTGCSAGCLNSDTDANTAHNNLLDNILISSMGRVIPSAFASMDGDIHDNIYQHWDITDSYHGALNICSGTCVYGTIGSGYHGTQFNVFQLNHCQFLGQGIMNDGFGCPYINVGNTVSPMAAGLHNVIASNLVHNVTDAGIQDTDGFAGEGIYLDNFTGGTTVTNNISYFVSDDTYWNTGGPQASGIPNVFWNNIGAYGRNGIWGHGSPTWYASGPSSIWQQEQMYRNLFIFDRNATSTPAFYTQRSCTSLVGLSTNYNSYEAWDYNTWWGTVAGYPSGFATYASAFHNQTDQAACENGSANWTFGTFSNWQGTINGITMAEDVHGQVSNPNTCCGLVLGPTGFNPTMTAAPITGFNFTATNFTWTHAGRISPTVVPVIPTIAAAFPGVQSYANTSY